MPEICAFCENPGPLTAEHVWPLRFEKYVPKPPGSVYRHQRNTIGAAEAAYHHPTFDQKVRAVCASCNHGWMADLDKQAESIVASLMRGRSVSLNTDSQELLARWALKVACMAEYLYPRTRRRVPRSHRQRLATGSLSTDTCLYVAHIQDVPPAWARLLNFDFRTAEGVKGDGYVLTFVLGALATRVIGFPGATGDLYSELSAEVAPWVTQLLPVTTSTVVLPPPNPLRGETELARFSSQIPLKTT